MPQNHSVKLAVLTVGHFLLLQAAIAVPLHFDRAQVGDSVSKSKPYSTGLELRSDPEGVEFGPYLRSVFLSIRQKLATVMPASAKEGEAGTVTVQFHIGQDGKVPDDFVKIVFSSGRKDRDEACLRVIRAAGPFENLPERFHGSFIELRQTFFFGPVKNPQ
jgi:TonB family protein